MFQPNAKLTILMNHNYEKENTLFLELLNSFLRCKMSHTTISVYTTNIACKKLINFVFGYDYSLILFRKCYTTAHLY